MERLLTTIQFSGRISVVVHNEDSLVKTLLHHLGLPEGVPLEPLQRKKEFTAADPLK
jgi:hypothetical protein